MKQLKKFSAIWFMCGTAVTIIRIFYASIVYAFKAVDFVVFSIMLVLGSAMAAWLGYSYGYKILLYDSWHLKNWLKVLIRGWLMAFVILFVTMLPIVINAAELMKYFHAKNYLMILVNSLFFIPVNALIMSIIGFLLHPLVPINSTIGGIALFVIRNKIRALYHHQNS